MGTENNNAENIAEEPKEYDPDKMLIQKSIPLILMKEVPLSFGELRILDLYLSLINSHDMEHSRVEIPLSQYCKIMGIKEPHTERLKKCMNDLLDKVIQVPAQYMRNVGESDLDTGWCGLPLFVVADVGSKNGKYYVILECSQRARMLFFNIDSICYVKYTLSVILSFSTKNGILFYLYLLKAQFDKKSEWITSIDDLKVACFKRNAITYYDEFKHFKQKVLDPSVNEVNEKTNLKVSYMLKRSGRNISEIKFTLETRSQDVVCDQRTASLEAGTTSLDDQKEIEDGKSEKGDNPLRQHVKGKMTDEKVSNANKRPRINYSKDFEEFWNAYPRKQDKGMALEKYKACINAGYKPEELLTAAKKYAEQCHRNHTEQKYIKMARTFLGPSHPFEEFLDVVLKEEPEKTQEELEQERQFEEQLRKKMGLDKLEEEIKQKRGDDSE